jgi:hypothetical protein
MGLGPYDRPYRVKEILSHCVRLQRLQGRGWEGGIPELMRMAVMCDPSEESAIILSRLLFRSRTGEPLRRPGRGQPGFFGETTYSDWPLEPIHLYQGVPFYIVGGWLRAGFMEPATYYLTYCLQNAIWNEEPYSEKTDAELLAIANEFVEKGPWKSPLNEHVREFILAQIE